MPTKYELAILRNPSLGGTHPSRYAVAAERLRSLVTKGAREIASRSLLSDPGSGQSEHTERDAAMRAIHAAAMTRGRGLGYWLVTEETMFRLGLQG